VNVLLVGVLLALDLLRGYCYYSTFEYFFCEFGFEMVKAVILHR
jgi:hypothetical protein